MNEQLRIRLVVSSGIGAVVMLMLLVGEAITRRPKLGFMAVSLAVLTGMAAFAYDAATERTDDDNPIP